MKTFKEYKSDEGEIVEIKQGWSWPAFFFGWLWGWNKHLGWQHNLWMYLGQAFLFPFVNIYYGYKGNIWLEDKYKEADFKIVR